MNEKRESCVSMKFIVKKEYNKTHICVQDRRYSSVEKGWPYKSKQINKYILGEMV